MISAEELFQRFKEANQEKYGHLSEKELKSACTSQFELIKQEMKSGNLEEVRLQYLFTVRASKYRVIRHLKSTYREYEKGNVKEENFKKYSFMLLEHIRKNSKRYIKYEKTIKEITGYSPEDIRERKY